MDEDAPVASPALARGLDFRWLGTGRFVPLTGLHPVPSTASGTQRHSIRNQKE